MLVRILTAAVGLPLLILIVRLGGLPLAFCTWIISIIGMYEFYKAVSGSYKTIHCVGFMMEALLIYLLVFHPSSVIAAVFEFMLFFFILLMFLVFGHSKYSVTDAAVTVMGFLYVGFLLSAIVALRQEGLIFVWFAFIFAFASDTGAYFAGSALGKHKLAPVLSPKKSIEGAVGGLLASAVVTVVYGLFIFNGGNKAEVIFYMTVFGLIGSVFAQLGDLTASSIKRSAGIKDYGSIFPGHGGVLDRFDSVLFTAPFALGGVYFLMMLM